MELGMQNPSETICPICDSDNVEISIREEREAFGLPGVTLTSLQQVTCQECGEVTCSIPSHGLIIREIRRRLCELGRPLVGPEVQFLRESLRQSQAQFATLLGTSNVTVSRWENQHNPIPLSADRFLRILTIADLDGSVDFNRILCFQYEGASVIEVDVLAVEESRFSSDANLVAEEEDWDDMVITLPGSPELQAA